MTRAATAATIIGALLVLAPAARAATPGVAATTSLVPRVHAFADTDTATVTVSVDPARVDPASVRVSATFGPYHASPGPIDRRTAAGGLVVLRFPYRLTCSTAGCLPHASERVVPLPPARIRWRNRGGASAAARVTWPPLLVASRLTRADVASPSFPARLSPPPPHYSAPPGALGGGLLALGALLAAGGTGALALLALRRRRVATVEPLQRALELVEAATHGDTVARRLALYQLALVLEEARLEPESSAARRLAWAPAMPDPEGMQLLSLVIREQLQEAASA